MRGLVWAGDRQSAKLEEVGLANLPQRHLPAAGRSAFDRANLAKECGRKETDSAAVCLCGQVGAEIVEGDLADLGDVRRAAAG